MDDQYSSLTQYCSKGQRFQLDENTKHSTRMMLQNPYLNQKVFTQLLCIKKRHPIMHTRHKKDATILAINLQQDRKTSSTFRSETSLWTSINHHLTHNHNSSPPPPQEHTHIHADIICRLLKTFSLYFTSFFFFCYSSSFLHCTQFPHSLLKTWTEPFHSLAQITDAF